MQGFRNETILKSLKQNFNINFYVRDHDLQIISRAEGSAE